MSSFSSKRTQRSKTRARGHAKRSRRKRERSYENDRLWKERGGYRWDKEGK